MDAKEALANILVGKLGLDIDPLQIPPDQPIQDMGMDSLMLVKFIYMLEDDYGISLKTQEILELNTFGDLLDLLDLKIRSQSI
jgi:acyl carrier protein